jgi:hypothetical protein
MMSHITRFIKDYDNDTASVSQQPSQNVFKGFNFDKNSHDGSEKSRTMRLRDKQQNTKKNFNEEELKEKFHQFRVYLQAFDTQIESDFDPEVVEET